MSTRTSANWKFVARPIFFAALALVSAMSTGCGTFMNQRTGDREVYGGVKRDWRDINAEKVPESQALVTTLDLPLSAIADTLCLPFDLAKDKSE